MFSNWRYNVATKVPLNAPYTYDYIRVSIVNLNQNSNDETHHGHVKEFQVSPYVLVVWIIFEEIMSRDSQVPAILAYKHIKPVGEDMHLKSQEKETTRAND